MVAYTTRMPLGFAGRITRSDSLTVETSLIDNATPPTVYGKFVKLVSGLLQPMASGDAANTEYGVLVSAYPVQSTTTGLGAATPPTSGPIDVLRRGYIAMPLKLGTAVKGGIVYMVTTAGGSVVVGDIVTSASPAGGGTAVATAGKFVGPADSGGVVEVEYNL